MDLPRARSRRSRVGGHEDERNSLAVDGLLTDVPRILRLGVDHASLLPAYLCRRNTSLELLPRDVDIAGALVPLLPLVPLVALQS